MPLHTYFDTSFVINNMPRSKKPGWIDWVNSAAREIILEDLEPSGYLFEKDDIPASIVWEHYKKLPEFSGPPVVFDQFQTRLKDHRVQAARRLKASKQEQKMMQHDWKLYPVKYCNHKNELVFYYHPAQECLRDDVIKGKHKTMNLSQFHASRKEYKEFDRKVFYHQIKQEIRRQKFVNYLEHKRTQKRKKFQKEVAKEREREKKKADEISKKKEADEVRENNNSVKESIKRPQKKQKLAVKTKVEESCAKKKAKVNEIEKQEAAKKKRSMQRKRKR
jgi:hypothetical protein